MSPVNMVTADIVDLGCLSDMAEPKTETADVHAEDMKQHRKKARNHGLAHFCIRDIHLPCHCRLSASFHIQKGAKRLSAVKSREVTCTKRLSLKSWRYSVHDSLPANAACKERKNWWMMTVIDRS